MNIEINKKGNSADAQPKHISIFKRKPNKKYAMIAFTLILFQKVRTFTAPNYSSQHNQKSIMCDSEIAGDSNKILKSILSRPVLVYCSKSGQRTLD